MKWKASILLATLVVTCLVSAVYYQSEKRDYMAVEKIRDSRQIAIGIMEYQSEYHQMPASLSILNELPETSKYLYKYRMKFGNKFEDEFLYDSTAIHPTDTLLKCREFIVNGDGTIKKN